MLTQEEVSRYSRHLIMPEVGVAGQEKLKAAKVLLIGTGGRGEVHGDGRAEAGVGTIGLVDFDVVDVSNLQRQVIHGTKDIGKKKIDSAEETMRDINPLIHIIKHEVALSSANALEILKDYDIIADGTDNFPTRFLINDACVLLNKPNVYASIFRFEGQATIFAAEGGPCYRCLYPEPPPPGLVPSCAEGGVLGILPGVVGLLQATEVVKLILGAGEPLVGRLLLYDALAMKFRELKLRKNPECLCATGQVKLIDYEQFCGIPKQPEPPPMSAEISPKEVKALIDAKENFVLIDVREPHEFQIGRIPTSTLIPLGDLPKKVAELDPSANYVLHCKMGGRSAKGCDVLRQAGFKNVRNMTGGISAWSDQVDPSVPKY
jgi:molybdopterin/thiamine biosynthesis adenylyltransferase/rhodanese-related sulfurtransferase